MLHTLLVPLWNKNWLPVRCAWLHRNLVAYVLPNLYFSVSITICPFVFFSFGRCGVFPASIYGFWLDLWCLDIILYNYIIDELDAARHIRSMKRAAHVVFKDDFNGALNKAQYTIDCTAWGGGVSHYYTSYILKYLHWIKAFTTFFTNKSGGGLYWHKIWVQEFKKSYT